jgi:hypothetical protein
MIYIPEAVKVSRFQEIAKEITLRIVPISRITTNRRNP